MFDIKAYAKEFIEPAEDFFENAIDANLVNDALKSVPIIKTFVAIIKVGKGVSDNLLKVKILSFFNGINSNDITEKEINEHIKYLEENAVACKEEINCIINYISNCNSNCQALRAGYLYKAYLKKNITQKMFIEFLEINSRLFEEDLSIFYKEIKEDEIIKYDYRGDRLVSIGFLQKITSFITNGTMNMDNDNYRLTEIGKCFLHIMKEYGPTLK